jgi:hypothetical protein
MYAYTHAHIHSVFLLSDYSESLELLQASAWPLSLLINQPRVRLVLLARTISVILMFCIDFSLRDVLPAPVPVWASSFMFAVNHFFCPLAIVCWSRVSTVRVCTYVCVCVCIVLCERVWFHVYDVCAAASVLSSSKRSNVYVCVYHHVYDVCAPGKCWLPCVCAPLFEKK